MGRFWALVTMAICFRTAPAQTFVPKIDRPMTGPSASRLLGERSDLERSMGQVVETPKLSPTGMASLGETTPLDANAKPGSSLGIGLAGASAVLLLGSALIFWFRARPNRPRTGHSA